MDWMINYDQLDDDQKNFVDNDVHEEGNIWIQGFAGSGKSVLLIHSLRIIRERKPHARICIVVYTRSLVNLFRTGLTYLNIDDIPVMTYHRFKNSHDTYDYILCDEVQDIPKEVLVSMRQRSTHVVVAGDSNQSIYSHGVDPQEIGTTLNAKTFSLTRIYRLTGSIIRAVQSLLPDSNIFSARRNLNRVDVEIILQEMQNEREEVQSIWQKSLQSVNFNESVVILLPTHKDIINFANYLCEINGIPKWTLVNNRYEKPDFGSLNRHLSSHGLPLEYIGNGYGSFDQTGRNKAILMTYHSVKGLDFENVFLPFMSYGTFIPGYKDIEKRRLLMVAMTRSRKNLTLTYSGHLHDIVEPFRGQMRTNVTLGNQQNNDDDDDFDI